MLAGANEGLKFLLAATRAFKPPRHRAGAHYCCGRRQNHVPVRPDWFPHLLPVSNFLISIFLISIYLSIYLSNFSQDIGKTEQTVMSKKVYPKVHWDICVAWVLHQASATSTNPSNSGTHRACLCSYLRDEARDGLAPPSGASFQELTDFEQSQSENSCVGFYSWSEQCWY